MLTHWNKLLNTDCTVMDIGPHTVYPIFRVGFTTLSRVCERKYVNEQIAKCQHIDVMIRDPEDRFVSGVNEYCRQNNLNVKETWKLVEQDKLVDRHFAPQYLWLLHLYKFYKGAVTIRPFKYIENITSVHTHKSKTKTKIPLCMPFIEVDQKLMKYVNQTVALIDIIKRYKHVLS